MLYAIGDLHLSGAVNKPMDVFGRNWENHSDRLIRNWAETVSDDDTVIINGDVSWAMSEKELEPDMELIRSLPGEKIISLGNHDYWFDSASKFYGKYPEIALLAKGNCIKYESFHICGTRGWLCPEAADYVKANDAKIYNREILRLKNSFDAAVRENAENIICVLHFPPYVSRVKGSGFLELIKSYPVRKVIFGHLHDKACDAAETGVIEGVEYILTSSDYLDFRPLRLL